MFSDIGDVLLRTAILLGLDIIMRHEVDGEASCSFEIRTMSAVPSVIILMGVENMQLCFKYFVPWAFLEFNG